MSTTTMEEEGMILSTHLLKHANGDEDGESPIDDTTSSITSTLILAAFVAVLGSLSSGLAVGYSSPVQAEIMEELNLSTAEYSLFGSMLNIGATLGAVVCGTTTDYIGRKRALALSGICYITGWFAIAVGQGSWWLDLGRLMLGFAQSIVGYAASVYIAEITPRNLRGGILTLQVLMLTIGLSASYLIGLITPWRTLALLGIIPSLVQIVGSLFIPESPRWLMMVGRDEEFEAALQRFRGSNADISPEAIDIKESRQAFERMSKVGILHVFHKNYAYALTVALGLGVFAPLVGISGITFYARSIFESAGFSGTTGTIALGLIQYPSVFVGIALMDKCGRRPLLMMSAIGLCLGCLLVGSSFVLKDHHLLEGFSPCASLVGLLIYSLAYPGLAGATNVIVAEIFPLNIKGVAISLYSVVTSISQWIVSYAFNFSTEWSHSGTFFVLASICLLTLIFVAKMVPETKGKTLEEVNASISHIWQ